MLLRDVVPRRAVMKTGFLVVAAGVLVTRAASGQLHVTSFSSCGELAWTNFIYRGLYSVEAGTTPSGPWTSFGSVVDLDWARTNLITFQTPLTNVSRFYRVAWMPPDPIGLWDYRGYDNQGTLVITGRLNLSSAMLLSSDPPVVYGVQGAWNLQYAGPPTNEFWYLGHQIGTGDLGGTLELHAASLTLRWPTNVHDNNMFLSSDLWSNTYTGRWLYITFGPVGGGSFTASRIASTNLMARPDTRERGKTSDIFQ